MRETLRNVLTEITPPIVVRGIKAALSSRRRRCPLQEGGERGPEWYDESFEAADHWRRHYSQSSYYFLWAVIADRIVRAGRASESILEVGCGSGQMACLLRDKGVRRYHGFDFSPKRVAHARKTCPEFAFSLEDAFQTNLFTTCDYGSVICTEFLEHVEGDIDVLNRIRSGARFYGTVPNFPFTSHVRHFQSEDEVRTRYDRCFKDFRVDAFPRTAGRTTYYVLEGEKT